MLAFRGKDRLELQVPCFRFDHHVPGDLTHVSFTRGDVRGYQEPLSAMHGVIEVLEYRKDFVRLRFSVDFGDRGYVEGAAALPLRQEAGYD
jgi:hypothetical protein